MIFWEKLNKYILWLTIFILPWQTRKIITAVYYQDYFVEYSSLFMYLTDLLLILLLLSWIPTIFIKKKFKIGPKSLFWSLILLIGWIWLSVIWVDQLGLSLIVSLVTAMRFTLFFLLYLCLINNVRKIGEIFWPLSLSVVFQGIIGIFQYFNNQSLNLRLLGESVLNPETLGIPVVIRDGMRQLRAHGTLPHANILGGYLSIVLILLSSWLYAIKRSWKHYLFWLIFALTFAGVILSFSRSAWAILTISLLFIFIWVAYIYPKKFKKAMLPNAIILIVIFSLVLSQFSAITSRFDSDQYLEQKSISSRVEQLSEFNNIYLKHPILGVGIGQYVPYLKQVDETNLGWEYRENVNGWVYNPGHDYYDPIHNIFLLVLIELGLPGLIIFISILLIAIYLALKAMRYKPTIIRLGTLLALIAVIALGLIDHYFWTLQQGRILLFLVLAMVVIYSNPILKKKL